MSTVVAANPWLLLGALWLSLIVLVVLLMWLVSEHMRSEAERCGMRPPSRREPDHPVFRPASNGAGSARVRLVRAPYDWSKEDGGA